MKKISNTLTIIFILLLFYLTKDINILTLTISFAIYVLFSGIFSTTSVKNVIEEYHDKKYYYSRDKIFKCCIISIILIGIFLILFSYLIGSALSIDYLNIINIFMSISLISNVLFKILIEYLEVLGNKKICVSLVNIYNIVIMTINIILSILVFKVFNLNTSLNIILLYCVNSFVFLIFIIFLYLFVYKNKSKCLKTREENRINFVNILGKMIMNNKIETMFNITQATYIYASIIILYYVLTNRYNYNYDMVNMVVTNTYFYGFIIFYFIYIFIRKYINIDFINIKENFNSNINRIVKIALNICILLTVISMPMSNLLFGSDYNILIGLIPLLFFYILYSYIISINIKYNKERNTAIILLLGVLTKIIFELPLINAVYRMGYSLTLGSILSTMLGLIVSMMIGLVFIRSKFKLNLLDNFNNLLNIIYESIIYSLVLVIFTLIVKVDSVSIIKNICIIIFYVFITVLYYIVRRRLVKK